MSKVTPVLGYKDIAAELTLKVGKTVTRQRLQQFVKWHQRNVGTNDFKPDGWGVKSTAPQHVFKRRAAERMKKAYINQRVLKVWKKK